MTLGIYISDKYTQYIAYGVFLILMVAILLYTISSSIPFQKFVVKNKGILVSFFVFILMIALIIFYLSSSGFQIQLPKNVIGIIFAIVLASTGILIPEIFKVPENMKKKKFDIRINITTKQFKPGDKIPLKLILKNNGSKIITNISIKLMASGLLLESDESVKIRALGLGNTEEKDYIIDIPSDSPAGDYIIQFKTVFYIETELLVKENKITISVIK